MRSAATGVTNLIMYDSIEAYNPGKVGSWAGSYKGVNLTRSEEQGYVPTVYYSEKTNVGNLGEDESWTEYSEDVDWSKVKSLAFDYGDQIIPPNHIVSVDILMHSPPEGSEVYAYNKYNASWNRVDPVTSHVYPTTEVMNSNVDIIAVGKEIDSTRAITITKEWEDEQTSMRPDSITVHVYQDGEMYGDYSITEDDGWTRVISGLPRFDFETGHEYVYSIAEESVTNYKTEISGDGIVTSDAVTITNTYEPSLPVPTGVSSGNHLMPCLLGAADCIIFCCLQKRKENNAQTRRDIKR